MKTIALVGNQNCGKTTLFNALTHSHQHVGNFPGVTVDKKIGIIKGQNSMQIIDLPGIYSLTPYSMEEKVTIDYLIHDKPDVILNIVDASHLERNLFLTLQLCELEIPIIIALNMIDIVRNHGGDIDVDELENVLKIPVVTISAHQKKGIDSLVHQLSLCNQKKHHETFYREFYHIQEEFNEIKTIIEHSSQQTSYPSLYVTVQIIENNLPLIHQFHFTSMQMTVIDELVKRIELKSGIKRDVIFIEIHYQLIEKICQKVFLKPMNLTEFQRCEKIDRWLTHPYFGIIIFIFIMFLIFYLTFHLIGKPLQLLFHDTVDFFTHILISCLESCDVSYWLISLIKDGICLGVGSTLSFLPLIMTLFFLLSFLEDTGYMARVAFMMDRLFRKIGLSGQSFVPLLIGFGCSVPAMMASRTLIHQKDKIITLILIPYISCSAKLPIYSLIIATFFHEKVLIAFCFIYLIGIFIVIFIAYMFKIVFSKDEAAPFLLELPLYKIPSLENIFYDVFVKIVDFLKKTFTVILFASILIWFLQNYNIQWQMVKESSQSLLSVVAKKISWIFIPLGFDDWQLITSLLTGICAKESIVTSLSLLFHTTDYNLLSHFLQSILTTPQALSFLTFCALYTPCMATLATCKKELHSLKKALSIAICQTLIAYVIAFLVYRISSFFIALCIIF